METRMFKRDVDNLRVRVRTVGHLTHEVDVIDHDGLALQELFHECEPRAAAAEAMVLYDEDRGQRVGRLSPTDFALADVTPPAH